jgi:2-polyprenyl-3-methyl-5-hydroxy-6-metoxy-1,4-benzoquinol methylase
MTKFKQHEIEWSDDKINNFWDWRHKNSHRLDNFFEYQARESIISFVSSNIKISGNVLNYGAGQGFLLESLTSNKDIKALYGCDFSEASAEVVKDKLKEFNVFKDSVLISSLPSNLPNDYFDVVFFLETVEHLTDEQLNPTLIEIHRILKPNGIIVCSTRNEEDLDSNKMLCPECGCVFHRVQHIRNFSNKSLSQIMEANKFEKVHSSVVRLTSYRENIFSTWLRFARDYIFRNKKENLMYIGKKIN